MVTALKRAKLAARFEGDVEVTADIRLLNADCAEDCDIASAEDIPAGTVMVIDPAGALPAAMPMTKKLPGSFLGGYIQASNYSR